MRINQEGWNTTSGVGTYAHYPNDLRVFAEERSSKDFHLNCPETPINGCHITPEQTIAEVTNSLISLQSVQLDLSKIKFFSGIIQRSSESTPRLSDEPIEWRNQILTINQLKEIII